MDHAGHRRPQTQRRNPNFRTSTGYARRGSSGPARRLGERAFVLNATGPSSLTASAMTPRRVTVGDSVSDVYDAYSQGFFIESEDGVFAELSLTDRVLGTSLFLFFGLDDSGTIEVIEMGYAAP